MPRSRSAVLLPAAVLVLAAVALRGSAGAQAVAPPPAAVTGPTLAPSPAPGALTFSLGSEPWGERVLRQRTHGVVAQLGYERRLGRVGSPFALRLAGDYWRNGGTFTPEVSPYAPPGAFPSTVTQRSTLLGGSVLGVYRAPFALGPVRPYALGGVGMYQYSRTSEGQLPGGATVAWNPRVRRNTVAYTGGLGGRVQLGRVEVFGEARVLVLPGLRGDAQHSRLPIGVGARVPF